MKNKSILSRFQRWGLLGVMLSVGLLLSGCGLVRLQDPAADEAPFFDRLLSAEGDPTPGILFVTERHMERDPTNFHKNWEIYLVQPDGSGLHRLTDNAFIDSRPDWAPDGRQIVFRSRRDGSADLFIMNPDGSNPRNLIRDPEDSIFDDFFPRWNPQRDLIAMYTDRFYSPEVGCAWHRIAYMPVDGGKDDIVVLEAHMTEQEALDWSTDGSSIAYSSRCDFSKEMAVELFLWNIDTDEVTQLTDDGYINSDPAFSNNGRYLAYNSVREDQDDSGADIYIMDLETMEAYNVTNSPGKDSQASWSPDDTQLAFVSDRDGNDEIYVIDLSFDPVPQGQNPRNITNHPRRDFAPAWSPVLP